MKISVDVDTGFSICKSPFLAYSLSTIAMQLMFIYLVTNNFTELLWLIGGSYYVVIKHIESCEVLQQGFLRSQGKHTALQNMIIPTLF